MHSCIQAVHSSAEKKPFCEEALCEKVPQYHSQYKFTILI